MRLCWVTPTFRVWRLAAAALVLFPAVTTADPTVGLILRDSGCSPGYTLFAPIPARTAYLVDNDGMLVHSWPAASRPGLSVYLTEEGQLLRTRFADSPYLAHGGAGGTVELVDWDGSVAWSWTYASETYRQHHDVTMLPNGNVLMIAWEVRTTSEALEAGRMPSMLRGPLLPDHLVEVDPAADSVVWEWHAWDHLVQDFDSTRSNYGVVSDHPELVDINAGDFPHVDWMHSNSVAYNPELDQVMLSVRYFNEVWVIDHSTTTEQARGHTGGRYGRGGDLLYRWGSPDVYRRGVGYDRTLFFQHDAQWIASDLPGAGNILVFNNGNMRSNGEYSSVDEFAPPVDSAGFYVLEADSSYGPDTLAWTHGEPDGFFADHISGCQRLPNGNTLVSDGPLGRIFEVTPSGRMLWLYVNPVTVEGPVHQYDSLLPDENSVFKARRYAPDYAGLAGRSLDPQGPIELDPVGVRVSGRLASGLRLTVVSGHGRHAARLRLLLPESAPVSLEVFDALGRSVAVLASGVLPAGEHELQWNCARAAVGSYVAVCRTRHGTETARLAVTH